jgi:phenylpropionate dioxygenase-like ring-hydroxylating dioxygenase large terminal subunit
LDQSIQHLLSEYDDQLPLQEASTIPASWYTDSRIAKLERGAVFGANWHYVARADQVRQPGQYIAVQVAGEPLVVVRGIDGKLRAFFNVCRHHAAAVAPEPCGSVQLFRCPYHGWSYGLDGSLKGTPDFTGVCNFDRAENGLLPLAVDIWEQFVFVSLDPPRQSLREYLGDIVSQVTPLNIGALHFFESRTYTLNCNWKVFVDNYLDGGYHVPYLHKGLNSVLEYSEYTIQNGDRFCLQSSPMNDSQEDAQVAATRTGERAYYYWIYPNFMINVYQGVMDTNLVIPMGIDKTKVIFDFYFTDISAEKHLQNAESVAVSDRIQMEDLDICEAVQRGLSSRAYQAGRLSVRREAGEHLFHRLLARDLKSGLEQFAVNGGNSK